MSNRDEIRVGVLGAGLAGQVFHAPLVVATPGLSLVGVAGSRHAQALLAEELDVVVVATPNRTHAQLAVEALEAGRHVVVDKPVGRTADEARLIADAAASASRLAIPFHNRRWDSDFLTLRRLASEGALGDVWRLESRFERWRPQPKPGWRELGDPEEAGGVLLDLGTHLVDQALMLLGSAELVHAELDVRRPGASTVDDAFLALRHRDGALSHLWMSAAAADGGPRFRVLGSRGAYVRYGLDSQEEALKTGRWSGDEALDGEFVTGEARQPVPTERGAWPTFYVEVAAAIRGEAPPPVTMDEAIAGLEILDRALAAVAPSTARDPS